MVEINSPVNNGLTHTLHFLNNYCEFRTVRNSEPCLINEVVGYDAVATYDPIPKVIGIEELWCKHAASAVTLASLRIHRDDIARLVLFVHDVSR